MGHRVVGAHSHDPKAAGWSTAMAAGPFAGNSQGLVRFVPLMRCGRQVGSPPP